MMAGLNHEETTRIGDDWAVDLEVTSNRPDCLGHIGIAREVAVLLERPFSLPAAVPRESAASVASLAKVRIECPSLCYRYTARVIRGVKVGPSPAWLANRLQTLGIAVINNVVDATNYVMMECSQPLHAFDLSKLRGREIVVREARDREPFAAIDHKTYTLERGMCVIADAQFPAALGGVMGGAESEVSPSTTDVLIESAEFAPMSIRTTARKLNLHSPSSYRFERGIDPQGLDWASRRCCELILDIAGGELASGAIDVGREAPISAPIILRLSQLPRILGIEVPAESVRRILSALGTSERQFDSQCIEVTPPSWRSDLSREIDLIEEVARIHGYDKIPEDVAVPMFPSHRRDDDRVLAKVRQVLTAAGFDEALTASLVPGDWCAAFSPWTDAAPLSSQIPMLHGADHLRVSLVPSLLEARRINESIANPVVELFETARIYLPRDKQLPHEQTTLALTSGADFDFVKGVMEALLDVLHVESKLAVAPTDVSLVSFLDPSKSCQLRLGEQTLGFLGELTTASLKQFGLRQHTTVAELSLELLGQHARLVTRYEPQSPYPAISRDVNLVTDESVRWSDLATTVHRAAGPLLESLVYRETYRDLKKDGSGKKRLLFSFSIRSPDRTMTREECDQVRDKIVAACGTRHGAKLLRAESGREPEILTD